MKSSKPISANQVDGLNLPVSTATQNELDLKVNSEDALLTGIPIAPTAPIGTDTDQIATASFVQNAIDKASANFVYTQNIPSEEWTVIHTLNKIPSVTVIDTAGTIVEGQVVYVSSTEIVITFVAAFSGNAVLN